jgi:hypothetical protein
MITLEDIKRVTKGLNEHRLDNLAKACANAESDEMKAIWYNKLKKLAEKTNNMAYFRKLIH